MPERMPQIVAEMFKYSLKYDMVQAVLDDDGIKGLQLSMENVFIDALGKGFKNILVIEDDAVFECDNPVEKINQCISELPSDFECLQLGANLVLPPEPYSENLMKVKYSHSTHAVIYSRSVIWKILGVLDKKTHLDALIYKHIQSRGNCYCSKELIINQRDGFSFIEKRQVKYGSMMRRKYDTMI